MKVVVAISAYRSDDAVLRLVAELHDCGCRFDGIVVVVSAGGDGLAQRLQAAGFGDCEVHAFAQNLGSAGNLFERLRVAAELDADFVLALNHDATVDAAALRALLDAAAHGPSDVGAWYPLRYTPGKGQYDITGVTGFAFRFRGVSQVPTQPLLEVQWSSSNGALYALAPFRAGVHPDATLWMGWEDYLYGLDLGRAGYGQWIVTAARAVDDYEYLRLQRFGRALTLSDKPVWYCYYGARNMALIALHRHRGPRRMLALLLWALAFPAHTLMARHGAARWTGLGYHFVGLWHGCLGRSGKWKLP